MFHENTDCKLSFKTVDSLSRCWFPKSFPFMGSLCLKCGRAITTISSAKYAISQQIVSSLRVLLLECSSLSISLKAIWDSYTPAMNIPPVVLTPATCK